MNQVKMVVVGVVICDQEEAQRDQQQRGPREAVVAYGDGWVDAIVLDHRQHAEQAAHAAVGPG